MPLGNGSQQYIDTECSGRTGDIVSGEGHGDSQKKEGFSPQAPTRLNLESRSGPTRPARTSSGQVLRIIVSQPPGFVVRIFWRMRMVRYHQIREWRLGLLRLFVRASDVELDPSTVALCLQFPRICKKLLLLWQGVQWNMVRDQFPTVPVL
jgi:hypothetical protein